MIGVRVGAPCLALVAALLVLAGCGIESDHPLSDDETTVLDDRLMGGWQAEVPGEESDAAGVDEEEPAWKRWGLTQVLVGRRPGAERTLEVVGLDLDDEGRVQVKRLLLWATRLGERTYVSLSDEERSTYLVGRYDLPDERTLRVWFFESDVVTQAIEDGDLEGTIEEKPLGGDLDVTFKSVRITAKTPALRAWVETNAETAFAEPPLVLRRPHSGD